MFCINCGKQLDEGSKFCIYCGATQEDADGGSVPGVAGAAAPAANMNADSYGAGSPSVMQSEEKPTKAGLILLISAMVSGFLAIGTIFFPWIAVESAEIWGNVISAECRLWDLITLMLELQSASGEDGMILLVIIVSIPLVLLGIGALLWLAGGIFWLITKTARKAWLWLVGSSLCLFLSDVVFLIMVFATRAYIDYAVDQAAKETFGISFKNFVKASDFLELKPAFWPWVMLVLAVAMLILLICAKRGLGKKIRNAGYHSSVPVEPMPSGAGGPEFGAAGPEAGYPHTQPEYMPTASAMQQPLEPINPTDATYPSFDDDDDETRRLGENGIMPLGGEATAPAGLVIFQDKRDSSQLYGCSLEGTVIIGRDPEGCNVIISSDKSISRKHCRLFKSNNVCYVEDLNSFNHTYVNDVMISSPTPLQQGDILKLGTVELMVVECDMNKN